MQHLRSLPTAAFVRRGAGAFAVAALALATLAPAASLAAGTPVATNDAYSTAEESGLVVDAPGVMANDLDANGIDASDLEKAERVTSPTHGALTLHDDGSFSYTPVANYAGPDSFTYRVVEDLDTWSAPGTVTLTVTPVNDAPTCTNGSAPSIEDHVSNLMLVSRCSDVDADPLSFSVATPPAHGALSVAPSGWSSYTPEPDWNGSDSFGVTASDGHGGTGTFSVGVTISAVNDFPVCSPASGGGDEDAQVPGSLADACTDVDGDALTFSRTTQAGHGTAVVAADGTFTYQPAANWHGSDSFTATAADGHGGTATVAVSLTVAAVNDAPACSDRSGATDEDAPASGAFDNCSDNDTDALTWSLSHQAGHGVAVVNANGSWTFTPAADWNGSDSFGVTASDGHGGTGTFSVGVTISAVNDFPVCSPASGGGDEDAQVPGSLADACTDVDGDALTFSRTTQAGHGTAVVAADGTFTYQPAANWHGSDSFTATAADGHGGTATVAVSLTVAAVNDAPACSDRSGATDEDAPASGAFDNCSDNDTDALTWSLSHQAGHGVAVVNANGSWTFTPAADWNGSDSFGVTASDGHGGTGTFSVGVTISAVNDAPVVADFPVVVAQNRALAIDALSHGTDVDHDVLSVTGVSQGLHGSVSIAPSGSLVYTPASAAYTGPDSFTYTVSDGRLSDAATVSVDVVRDTDPPVAVAPGVALLANPSATTLRLIASWSGTDSQTAVAAFDVEWRLGAAAWKPLYHGAARSTALRVPTGTTSVGFRVVATDLAGNASAVMTSTWTLRRADSASAAVVRHGTWRTIRSTGSVGRSYLVARSKGAWVAWTVNGPATVGIVAPTVVGGGTARIYVDGVYRAAISFASTRTQYARLLAVISVAGPGRHTIRIVSRSRKVAPFDAFFSVAAKS